MNKLFLYFEIMEGGMYKHEIHDSKDLSFLYGWMSESCYKEDICLSSWMEDAEIGDWFDHRLGTCVRIFPSTGLTGRTR